MTDRATLLASLRGRICPACGAPKRPGHSLCRTDYAHLVPRMQQALYRSIGAGYEAALGEAIDLVKTPEGPFWPVRSMP